MANRTCPLCFGQVPRSTVVTHSYDIACPHCGRALELSRQSRLLASLAGLVAAVFVFHFTRSSHLPLGWVLSIVSAFIAFGVASALFLLLTSDLVVKLDSPLRSVHLPEHLTVGHH
jgi:hypothetical protein